MSERPRAPTTGPRSRRTQLSSGIRTTTTTAATRISLRREHHRLATGQSRKRHLRRHAPSRHIVDRHQRRHIAAGGDIRSGHGTSGQPHQPQARTVVAAIRIGEPAVVHTDASRPDTTGPRRNRQQDTLNTRRGSGRPVKRPHLHHRRTPGGATRKRLGLNPHPSGLPESLTPRLPPSQRGSHRQRLRSHRRPRHRLRNKIARPGTRATLRETTRKRMNTLHCRAAGCRGCRRYSRRTPPMHRIRRRTRSHQRSDDTHRH